MSIELSQKVEGMTNFIGRYDGAPTIPIKDYSTMPPTYWQAQEQPDNLGGIVARVASPVEDLHGAVEFIGPEYYLDVDGCNEQEIVDRSGKQVTLIFTHRAS